MSKLIIKKYLSSLRVRYAITAMLFGLIIMLAAFLAYFSVTSARQSTAHSIEIRQQLLQRNRLINNAVWQAYENLELFLFNPNKDLYQDNIHNSINEALLQTQRLLHKPEYLLEVRRDDIEQLEQLLIKLDDSVTTLIRIRTDAVKQYPSLALARGTMLENNNAFTTATTLAIAELLVNTEKHHRHDKIYHAFVQARHHWTQLTSNFRMYLANRLGTFDNNVFHLQVTDIELQREALLNELKFLKKNTAALDLQGETSLETMLEAAEKWYQSFLTVKGIHESNAWRTDAVHIQMIVEPLLDDIRARLQNLDRAIESSSVSDVRLLTRLATSQTNTLWLLAGLAVLFVLATYILLEKTVLRPLSMLTNALKAEAENQSGYPLPQVTNIETQHLMDAFSRMRTQIHSRQNALEYQALHDDLTGLANRNLVMDRLHQALSHSRRHHTPLSLMIIDLDGFKEVNDTLGHQMGDELLKEVGQRLLHILREIDTVARLGGDEFAILLPEDSEQQASEVAKKILKSFEQEFMIQDISLFIGASIGIAASPSHANNAQDLIKFADVAMYVAKRNKLGHAIYDSTRDPHNIGRLSLAADLRNAHGTDAISLVYQPKTDFKTGQLCGVEALFRWTHPQHGPVSAGEAITLAEQTGYINKLTLWIIDEVTRQYQEWLAAGHDISIAINLSPYNLQSEQIIRQITRRLNEPKIQHNMLSFEITENAMLIDPSHAIQTMQRFSELGASISIDDFGTGFSSLSYLKKMPVNELKIDKSFVLDMTADENDYSIVRSIIDLAHNLGLKVVAEGVEDKQIWQQLSKLDCDIAQGYHICRPLPANDVLEWVRKQAISNNTPPIH